MLWIPILLQLMIPVRLKLPVFHSVPVVVTELQTTVIQITKHIEELAEPSIIEQPSISFMIYPKIIWMTGILVMSILFLRSAWLLNKRIQDEAEECQDERVYTFIPEAIMIKPIVLPHLSSSALPLIRWDLLLIPKDTNLLSYKELELMIAHEMIHIKYQHRFLSCLLHVVKIIYWFNPLIWIMNDVIHQEMEMICDELIAEHYTDDLKIYGNLLIQMQSSMKSFEGMTLSRKARNTKERLGNLMNKKHKSYFALLAAVLVLFLTTLPLFAQSTKPTLNNDDSQLLMTNDDKDTNAHFILSPKVSQSNQKLTPQEFIAMMVQPIDSFKITCRWGCYIGHEAIDVINTENRYGNVYAVYEGVVTETGYDNWNGNYIIIDHLNGYQTYYHHLSEIHVTINQEVKQKDMIGLIGKTGVATGPHLHLQLVSEGSSISIDSLFEE